MNQVVNLTINLGEPAGAHAVVSPSTHPTATALPSSTSGPLVASTVTPTDTGTPGTDGGLGDFTYANLVTLAAALIAATGVIITLLVNAARSRRENLTNLYADALGAVAEYLEGPYRILRKDGEKTTRFAITSKLSDVKTSIDHNQALLRLHARPGVANAYDAFVNAAKEEAGKQMHGAWNAPPVTTDEGVNLHIALPRGNSQAARGRLVEVMQADLHLRRYNPKSWFRYWAAVKAVSTSAEQPAAHEPAGAAPPVPDSSIDAEGEDPVRN